RSPADVARPHTELAVTRALERDTTLARLAPEGTSDAPSPPLLDPPVSLPGHARRPRPRPVPRRAPPRSRSIAAARPPGPAPPPPPAHPRARARARRLPIRASLRHPRLRRRARPRPRPSRRAPGQLHGYAPHVDLRRRRLPPPHRPAHPALADVL